MNSRYFIAAIIFLLLCQSAHAQVKTNADLIHELVDQSIDNMTENLSSDNIIYYFEFSSLPEYNILKNRALLSASNKISISEDKTKSVKVIKYNIESAGVYYNKTFKDGFLGSYFVERQAFLKSNYLISSGGQIIKSDEFENTITDSVEYDKIKELESISLAFTRAKLPPEPFFPSLIEPAIAIAAIAVTVVLFFTIRSN